LLLLLEWRGRPKLVVLELQVELVVLEVPLVMLAVWGEGDLSLQLQEGGARVGDQDPKEGTVNLIGEVLLHLLFYFFIIIL
jgi:hypothetical protein